jgi:lipoic acid synthetase
MSPSDPSTPAPAPVPVEAARGADSATAGQAYDPSAKQKAGAKTSRIPIKVVRPARCSRSRDWIRVRAGSHNTRFYEIKTSCAPPAAHGVRGSQLPEHRRVLRQGHGHLHDHGRQVHPALPVLRRRPRRPDPLDASEPENLGRTIAAAEAELCGDHQRRSRRPA